jgi:anti-anti-sigma regulatory factor
MVIDALHGSDEALVVLRGTFDTNAVEKLHETLLGIDPHSHLTLDFREVRLFHDTAVARLAKELAGRRVTLLGLSDHHHRLMRYFGAPPTEGR